MKKSKLVWGLILIAIGVVGICSSADKDASYFIISLVFDLVGLLLLVAFIRDKKKYNARINEANALSEKEKQLANKRLDVEKARLDAEAEELRSQAEARAQAAKATRICPHCGATISGNHCDYCDSDL